MKGQRTEDRGQKSEEGKESSALPKGWELAKLGDVCSFEYGKALKNNARKKGGMFPVVGSNGCVDFHDKWLVSGPGVVIGRKGAAGEVSFINKDFWPIDTTYFLKLSSDFSLLYFYYLLKSLRLTQFEKSTAIPGLNRNDAYDQTIPLPPTSEQHRIVAKIEELFSSLDKGIENLKTAQQKLKVYRQAVLKWAFEGKLTNENVADGELPKGWKWVKIIDLVERNKNALKAGPFGSSLKKEFYVKEGYKIYGQEQVISGDPFYGDYYVSENKYQELYSNKVKPFDILISLVGTVGKVLILPENCIEGIINPRLIKISLDPNVYLPEFFKYYFESSSVKMFYGSEAQGTTMDVLNLTIIKKIDFPLCSLAEQQRIVSEIESRLSVCDKIEETIDNALKQAESLHQSILKKAFEGKLVPQDPNDPPASELIARIRAERERNKAEAQQPRQHRKKRR